MKRSMTALVLWVLLTCQSFGQSPEEFDQGLDAVHRQMKRKQWQPALADLRTLLAANERLPHVYPRSHEVIEDLKSCLFYSRHPEPEFQDLVGGKILKYNERSGAIKIQYDFTLADFARGNDVRFHPASFAGPYSLTFKGESYPVFSNADSSPYVVVAAVDDFAAGILLGQPLESTTSASTNWMPGRINLWDGKTWTKATEKETPPCRVRKPFVIEVDVTRKDIRVSYNGRVYMTAKKAKDAFGSFGVQRFKFDELIVEGKVETSWLAGLVDQAMQAKLVEFEKSGVLAQEIPAWLNEQPTAEAPSGEEGSIWPAKLNDFQKLQYERVLDLLDGGDYLAAERAVGAGAKPELTESARRYVQATIKEARGDFSGALEDILAVRKIDPAYYWAAWRVVDIRLSAGQEDEAKKAIDVLMKDFPGRADGYSLLCFDLMSQGLIDDVRRLVERGRAIDGTDKELAAIAEMLVKAEKGPRWRETFEYKSRHYHVSSDIDKKTCVEAAETLEQAYLAYSAYLRGDKVEFQGRFRVFLFSGEAGYSAYAADVLGDAPRHTAGLFSPRLKQLLIWNLPDRESMMRTVQHEGFHQYVDQILPTIPTWLNEGLAEYYECAGSGTWNKGIVRADHLAVLKERGTVPLKTFLFGRYSTFYANAGQNYAQAWAFVHFLRHSSRENQALFKQLMEALRETRSDERALQMVFGQLDLPELEKAFKAHISGLQ